MKPTEFCYWLQGLFELGDPKELSAKQTDLIRRHLSLVFFHEIDPSYSDDPDVQAAMQAIHDGTPPYNPLDPGGPIPPSHPYPAGGAGGSGGITFRC